MAGAWPSEDLEPGGTPPDGLGSRLMLLARLRWGFAAGLLAYAVVVVALFGGSPYGVALPTPVFLAALPLFVVAQNLLVGWALRDPGRYRLGVLASLGGDLACTTIGLHGTGGVASWLWALYPLVTIEAAYITRDMGRTVATAVGGVSAFLVVQALERTGWLSPVATAFTVDEQGRPMAYVAAKVAWVALMNAGATAAALTAIATLDRAHGRLVEAHARLAHQYEALKELDRLKGNFLAVVSHELRTPLTIAGGYAELAEDDPGLTDEGRAYLAATTRAINVLAGNVDLMIAYAGLAEGEASLRLEPLRAADVVAQVFEAQEAACREAGVVLMHEEPPEALRVDGDVARLAMALGELVENARQATPPGGTIGLAVRTEGADVAFEVWDTGPGVPARVRARLGEAFLQPEAVLTEHTPGLGLGLAYAHLVAARHGGSLAIADRPDGGAVVRLRVPRAPAGPSRDADPGPAAEGLAGRHG